MMKKKNTKAMYDMVKKMNRGGGPIIGRIKPKDMEKVTPIGPKKIDSGASTEKNLKKPTSDVKRGPAKKEAKVKRLRKKADSLFGRPGKKSPKRVGRLLRKAQRIEDRFYDGGKMKSYKAGGAVKPDFIDIDGDGNKEESMKEAAKGNNQAYKGMKIKKAKGGMKVYNNGGKEDPKKLATPEEIKASRKGSQRGRTDEQKKARKEAKKQAKRQARRVAPGTGDGLVKTATTRATGPESLTSGQVRRRGRRLERAAERAGLKKDDAYDRSEKAAIDSLKKADAAKKEAQAAGDKKGERKAQRQMNRLSRVTTARNRYEGMDKKRAVIPVKGKKPAKPGGDEEKKKNKGRGKRILSAIKKAGQRSPSGPKPRSQEKKGVQRITSYIPGGWRGQGG